MVIEKWRFKKSKGSHTLGESGAPWGTLIYFSYNFYIFCLIFKIIKFSDTLISNKFYRSCK